MYLALDPGEQDIKAAAASFLRKEFPLRRLHACPEDPSNLAAFAGLGWFGLSAPEEVGGAGLGLVEEMLFFVELGRVAGPLDVLSQVLAVAVARDDPDLCASLLRGEAGAALLVKRAGDDPGRVLGSRGSKYAVLIDGQAGTLFELDASKCHGLPCLDRSVVMQMVEPAALRPVLTREGDDVRHKATIAASAMLLGAAQASLDLIVEYAKQRTTFGRPIGAYQAVRHPCADMAVRVEAARALLFYAATSLQEGHADAAVQVDAAALLAQQAAMLNVDANIQLHGGIGITDEHDAHLLLKRANLLTRFVSGRALRKRLLEATTGEPA